MAVTINSQPSTNDLMSPYRPIEITVTSDDIAPAPYCVKMKCFINLDGAGTDDNANTPIILDPNIGTNYTFTFDISSYLAGLDTLTSTIQNRLSDTDFDNADTNSVKAVKVKFTEVLLQGDGTLADGASSSYTNTFYVINGVWQHDEISDKFDNYVMPQAVDTALFLSNNRNAREVKVDDSYFLSLFTTRTNDPFLKVVKYSGRDKTGTSLQTRYRQMVLNGKRPDMAIGPRNINASSGWVDVSSVSASVPVIDTTVGSYSVQLLGNGPTAGTLSEEIVFNLDHDTCEEHTRIKFLNRLGAFEYFTFKGYRERSTSVRNQYYKRALDTAYSVDEGGDRVMYSDIRTEFTVHSQPLKEADRIWLEEMLDGHECFVEEGNNYIPIKVRAGKTMIIDEDAELSVIKMTYQYANEVRRQHGGY
jgi:hypothetical protein